MYVYTQEMYAPEVYSTVAWRGLKSRRNCYSRIAGDEGTGDATESNLIESHEERVTCACV